jgi:hypothetical protein
MSLKNAELQGCTWILLLNEVCKVRLAGATEDHERAVKKSIHLKLNRQVKLNE